MIGLWCNGNTADSGPAFPGSSPGSPTKEEADENRLPLFVRYITYSSYFYEVKKHCPGSAFYFIS